MNMILKGQTCLYSGWKDKVTAQKQAYNSSNYNVSVSAGVKDNTVIIFYLYTIQVTTFTMYIIELIISSWIVIETHSAFLQVDFHELPSVSQIPSA